MLCRNCGIEIADKAIVCYRCGTSTTDPVRKAVAVRRRRGPLVPIVILLILALLGLMLGYQFQVFGVEVIVPRVSLPSATDAVALAVLIDFPAVHA